MLKGISTSDGGYHYWAEKKGETLEGTANKNVFHAIFANTAMTGRAGNDEFHLSASASGSTILDFNPFEDRIFIDGIGKLDPSKIKIARSRMDSDYLIFVYEGVINFTLKLAKPLDPNVQGYASRVSKGNEIADAQYVDGYASVAEAKAKKQNKTWDIPKLGEIPLLIKGFSAVHGHSLAFDDTLQDKWAKITEVASLQAGNNKKLLISISDDGKNYKPAMYLLPPNGISSYENWLTTAQYAIQTAAEAKGISFTYG